MIIAYKIIKQKKSFSLRAFKTRWGSPEYRYVWDVYKFYSAIYPLGHKTEKTKQMRNV